MHLCIYVWIYLITDVSVCSYMYVINQLNSVVTDVFNYGCSGVSMYELFICVCM